jgi:hypothetical protein
MQKAREKLLFSHGSEILVISALKQLCSATELATPYSSA